MKKILILLFFNWSFSNFTSAQLTFNSEADVLSIASLQDSITQTKIIIKGQLKDINLSDNNFNYVRNSYRDSNQLTTFFKYPIDTFIQTINHESRSINLNVGKTGNQNTHPCILYTPKGFGPFNYKYWLAFTPYPDSRSKEENPSIFSSYDGVNWENPIGVSNPIVQFPGGIGDHNADPTICLNADSTEIWMYFEQKISSPYTVNLLRIKTTDGIKWSLPETILTSNNINSLFISPSLVYEKDKKMYYMWTNNNDSTTNKILELRESVDGLIWSKPIRCSVKTPDSYGRPWHFDMRKRSNYYEALITMRSDKDNLYYARSTNKSSWNSFRIMQPIYDFEKGSLYKSTFLPYASDSSIYQILYSAYSGNKSNKWSIHETWVKIDSTTCTFLKPVYKFFPQNTEYEKILFLDSTYLRKYALNYEVYFLHSSLSKQYYSTTYDSMDLKSKDGDIKIVYVNNEEILISAPSSLKVLEIEFIDMKGILLANGYYNNNNGFIAIKKNFHLRGVPLILRAQAKQNSRIVQQTFKFSN